MYSLEERAKAVKLYIDAGCNESTVIRTLGYPSPNALRSWYKEYLSSSKTLRTSFGDVEVSVPRDRKSEFDPIILKKNQTSISQEIEAKIISMYSSHTVAFHALYDVL